MSFFSRFELKNATTNDRAKVAATGSIAEGDNALGVQAPVLGVTSGAALDADGAGTLQQYLRGLLKAFIARIPVIGPQLASASMSVTPAVQEVTTIMNAAVMDQDRSSIVVDLRGKSYWMIELAAPSDTHIGVVRVYLGNTDPPVDEETLSSNMTHPANGSAYNETISICTGGAAYGYVFYDFTAGTGAFTIKSCVS